jgi:acyl-CoA synthetase (AMP-forming)/AMP-acid ligase II
VALALLDDDGSPVASGEVGRVHLRSGAVMRGYWADRTTPPSAAGGEAEQLIDHEATAAVRSSDGWIRTGDFGRLDDRGNLTLAGRDNELYIRGGYNVLPAEVEAVLAAHPAVRAVAVLGAPDTVLGEVGVAFVVLQGGPGTEPTPDLAELRRHCGAQLADYKAPDALVVLDALPLTPMMKVDRRALGPQAAEAAANRPRSPKSHQSQKKERRQKEHL